jgi:N-acetylneuraminic acid mutarotase
MRLLLKTLMCLAVLFTPYICPHLHAQQWAWMGGSGNTAYPGISGIYGTKNTPAAMNIPGARVGAVTWTDTKGNLWLFGGDGYDSVSERGLNLNDLWEFNPLSNNWAWIGGNTTVPNAIDCSACGVPGVYGALGLPSPGNSPGGRTFAVSWTDSTGNFWLFGGNGIDSVGVSGFLNDLWEFSPSAGEWTWKGGSSTVPHTCPPTDQQCGQSGAYGTKGVPAKANIPGARQGAFAWTDSHGNLWLFGGQGFDSSGNLGLLNDLWEFSSSTQEWTWVGGSSSIPTNCPPADKSGCGQPEIRGSLKTPAIDNAPSGRQFPMGWVDAQGNLWLFGGEGYDVSDTCGSLNDLWEFNPVTKEWAWVGGSTVLPGQYLGPVGVYGTKFVPAPGNSPGGRSGGMTWTDKTGKLWLFGGNAVDDFLSDDLGPINDLWVFDPSVLEWTWMGGAVEFGQPGMFGTYATLGAPAPLNAPGGRYSSANWVDQNGNPWFFGGWGNNDANDEFVLDDLWYYPVMGFLVSVDHPSLAVQSGGHGTVAVNISSVRGFNSAVSFTCSGLPVGASCSFSPASVTPTSGTATTQLTITDSSRSAALRSRSLPLLPASTLPLGLCIFGWRRRRGAQFWLLLIATAGGLSILAGCSGAGVGSSSASNPTPTPVTSNVTVTAVSGTLHQAATLSLTVN